VEVQKTLASAAHHLGIQVNTQKPTTWRCSLEDGLGMPAFTNGSIYVHPSRLHGKVGYRFP
jgi:hypothetical protein